MKKEDIIKRANKNIATAKVSGIKSNKLINPEPYPGSTPADAPRSKKKPGTKR